MIPIGELTSLLVKTEHHVETRIDGVLGYCHADGICFVGDSAPAVGVIHWRRAQNVPSLRGAYCTECLEKIAENFLSADSPSPPKAISPAAKIVFNRHALARQAK